MKRPLSKALALVALLATPAIATDRVAPGAAPAVGAEPISAAVSYTLNLPLSEGAMLVDAANNRAYKRSLYQKAATECQDLLATIAKKCHITNISVSTNENRYAGQPATLYVSVNVNMMIVPK
jgi:hypothetical protein